MHDRHVAKDAKPDPAGTAPPPVTRPMTKPEKRLRVAQLRYNISVDHEEIRTLLAELKESP